jgi:hypothetical protein
MGCTVRQPMWFCSLVCFSLACCSLTHAASCPAGQLKTADTLAQIERAWASALEQRDTAALGCILGEEFQDADPEGAIFDRAAIRGEEFQDADPEGAIFDRAATLSKAANHRPVHHELHDLNAHVYGDFGYIRGLATAADAQGKIVARVRFTDIYIYRNQRWQAVAAHESMLPETPKAP